MSEKKAKKSAVLPASGKQYTLVSLHSGKAVEAGPDDTVTMQKAARRKAQYWMLEPAEEGAVKLVSAATGKVLDITWEGTDNGAQLHQWDYVGGANQQWILESVGKDICKIKSKASGKCLDIVDISKEDGALLQIWEDVDGENQYWIFKEVKLPAPKAEPKSKKTPAKK